MSSARGRTILSDVGGKRVGTLEVASEYQSLCAAFRMWAVTCVRLVCASCHQSRLTPTHLHLIPKGRSNSPLLVNDSSRELLFLFLLQFLCQYRHHAAKKTVSKVSTWYVDSSAPPIDQYLWLGMLAGSFPMSKTTTFVKSGIILYLTRAYA